MMIPDDTRPASPPRRRLWLLGLPVLAALLWAGMSAAHRPALWQRAVREFRADPSLEAGPNPAMTEALLAREALHLHPETPLSVAQSAGLVRLINSPINDQSQSEALDVLSLALRANDLPPEQARQAQQATLRLLEHSPGPMVRLESARFLGHLGGSRGTDALRSLQNDADPKVRQAAGEALARVQQSAYQM